MSIQFPIHIRPNMIISQIYRITSLVISTVYAMLPFQGDCTCIAYNL